MATGTERILGHLGLFATAEEALKIGAWRALPANQRFTALVG